MDLQLKDKVALVTGGTRGIGRAIALKLAGEGVQLVLNYLRNRQAAEATAAEIKALSGREPLLIKANIGEPDKVQALVETLRTEIGRVDLLISNAASGVLRSALALTPRHLQWTLNINASALLWLVQGLRPLMPPDSRIVAVSSLGALRALPYYAAVGASKAALESLVRHLSLELAPMGININILSAGVVDTEALSHFPNREALLAHSLAQTPAGRLVTPEEVADAALFLCSPLARMIHGQTLVVDGGYSIVA